MPQRLLSFDGFGSHGLTGGVFIGYDQQIAARVVLGIEAGYYWTGSKTEVSSGGMGVVEVGHPNFYNVRGRLGYIASPSTMIYGLVGHVHADARARVSDGGPFQVETFSRNGIEFGGGIETWLNPYVSLKAEYTHSIFKDKDLGFVSNNDALKTNAGTGILGLVFHFNPKNK